jgi:hypothetical protein
MQKVLEKPNAVITIDAENGILHQKWIGFIKVEDFCRAIDLSVECFRNYPLSYILSDTSDQAVLAKEGSDYAASVMPDLMQHGLKKIAFVLPRSTFTKLSVENFMRNSAQSVVGNFASREEALTWLLQTNT